MFGLVLSRELLLSRLSDLSRDDEYSLLSKGLSRNRDLSRERSKDLFRLLYELFVDNLEFLLMSLEYELSLEDILLVTELPLLEP